MSKTKRAFYNVLATSIQMIVAQVISLVVSRKVLEIYGSNVNGINAILSNVMDWILLLEGGLTTATNVALFKPFVNKEYDKCSRILSATKKRFLIIGALILGVGLVLAIAYPPFIKTDVRYIDIVIMFTMMSASTAFSVGYVRKYALMFNVSQREYVNTILHTAFNILSGVCIFIAASFEVNYLYIRLIQFVVTIVNGLVIAIIIKKQYSNLNYKAEPDFESIKGTSDVVFQKLTGLLRSSAPLFFISIFVSASYASVYSVYILIYGFIRKLVLMVVTSTQSGIGQLIAEKPTDEVYKVFRIYEYTSIICVCLLMSIAIPMTMPFVRFYTQNVVDMNYVDFLLMFFIATNIFVQVLHIPSGTVINMSGKFKEDKNFQLASSGVLLICSVALNFLWGIYGILLGVLLGAVVLAVCEIVYARSKIFKVSYLEFFRPIIINLLVLIPIVLLESYLLPEKFTVLTFILYGLALALVNGTALVLINLIFEKKRFIKLFNRFKGVFKRG